MGLEDRDCVTLMLLKHIFKIEDIDYGQSSFIMYFVQSDQVKVLVAYHSVIWQTTAWIKVRIELWKS